MPRQKKRTPKTGVDMSAHFSIPALLKYTAPDWRKGENVL